ncbi:hypothetical protein HanIR_Chr13g0658111 [Helianthus annuus]|nr:hypothetical protein HanIR_Chr13g0658111 [Helianthus annuus]
MEWNAKELEFEKRAWERRMERTLLSSVRVRGSSGWWGRSVVWRRVVGLGGCLMVHRRELVAQSSNARLSESGRG